MDREYEAARQGIRHHLPRGVLCTTVELVIVQPALLLQISPWPVWEIIQNLKPANGGSGWLWLCALTSLHRFLGPAMMCMWDLLRGPFCAG